MGTTAVLTRRSLSALFFGLVLITTPRAWAALTWDWSYTGAGSNAGGTFRTLDMADSSGFYLIVDIAGFRDGDPITGLQPTGTSIPGNSPFVVDNLISISGPQLTGDGFGFSTASGDFANVFFADFLPVPGYLEFFSVPPFAANVGPEDSELPIAFSAMPRVPEPATSALLAFGIVGLVMARTRRRTPSSVAPRDGVAMHNRPDDNSALRVVPDSTHAAA